MSDPKPYIGGQAVIEGVMMRAPGGLAVAVRRPDGTIVVKDSPLPAPLRRGIWKLPGFRGVATLYESLSLGYSALAFSAEQQEENAQPRRPGAVIAALAGLALFATSDDAEGGKPPSSASTRGAMFLSTLLALGLFIALPQALATFTGWLFGIELPVGSFAFHALTGLFKLLVLTAYLLGISRIPEIRRVFQYHGAEHKTIHAYEAGLPLDVASARAQTTLHPRCGTTFLVVVVFVSVVIGAIVTPLVLPDAEGITGNLATLALRIALLPAIAAVSYELQRLGARYCTTGPLRVLLWPGFLFQKITTRPPDDDQLEVAVASMQAALARKSEAAADEPERVRVFDDLADANAALAT